MKQLLFLCMSLLFIGCSQEVPPVKRYRLEVQIPKVQLKKSYCEQKSLKILFPSSTYEYTTNDFYYVQGDEEGIYTQSNWVRTPANDIYYLILKNIRKSGIFHTVESYSSVAKGDLNLEIEIEDFKQYFSKDAKRSYVVVDLTLTLIDKKNYQVVAQQSFYNKILTTSADAQGGVVALSRSLEFLLPQMIKWLGENCK